MKLNTRIRNIAGAAAFSLSILLSSAVLTTPSTYAAQPFKGSWTVTIANTDGDTIRVRNGAGSSYDQIAEAHEGETASILDGPGVDSKGNTWYKVELPHGSGWIRSDFLAVKGQSSSSSSAKSSAQASSSKSATSTSSTQKASTASTAKSSSAPATPKLSGLAKVANTDGDNLNIRKDPNQKGAVLSRIAEGTTVVVKQGPVVDSAKIAWYQVNVDGVTGWAMAQYLAQAPVGTQAKTSPAPRSATQPQAQPAVQKTTKPASAPVQASASAPKPAAPAANPAAAKPAVAPKAAPATQAAPSTTQSDSRSGQSRAAVQPAQPAVSSLGPSIVSLALKYVGYRYRFGGTTPAGFDCSGFVYYVVNHSGRSISRDMGAQFGSGTRVSSSNLQPGDLLFFSNTYKRGLSHAGIYIGNGRFVHAENESTGVTVSDLWSAYWASHYTGSVRLH